MAKIQLDLQVRGACSADFATTLERGIAEFREACVAHGLEVRGNGLDIVHDPAPVDIPAPLETDPAPADPVTTPKGGDENPVSANDPVE